MFTGDDVFRPIKTLSGGEKNKLVLAGLTTLSPNVLVLDEPTNHLDMDSREALAEVLREFKGTLLLVSHDRWLLGEVTNCTLDVRRDGVRQFPGSYAEYRARLERAVPASAPTEQAVQAVVPTLSPRELSKEISRLAKAIEGTESEIEAVEAEIARREVELGSPDPKSDLLALTAEYGARRQHLDELLARWHDETEQLEALRAMQGVGDV